MSDFCNIKNYCFIKRELNFKIEFVFLCYRSKSRSVDHGFSPPFDLESLRSKVEGRFESVDRLSKGKNYF